MGATIEIDLPADIAATLVDPAAYADHRLHDAYRWLRANNPLGIARVEGFDPFWVVTKHAHIQTISRQNDLFHNADRPTTLTNRRSRSGCARSPAGRTWCARWFRWMRPIIPNIAP